MQANSKSSTRVRLRSAVVPASGPVLSIPPMSRQEFLDLEREAGRPFISDEQAYLYRMAKIFRLSVEQLLTERSASRVEALLREQTSEVRVHRSQMTPVLRRLLAVVRQSKEVA